MQPIIDVILHNVRSLYNVGSFFRTCDGAGVRHLYLTGYTGFPPRKEISKTALGAEEHLSWSHHWELLPLLEQIKAEGTQLVAVERNPRSQHYLEVAYRPPVALLFGNEVTGIEAEVEALCDATAQVPMHGFKESLNVAVCGGILLYGVREALTRSWVTG
jgi:23S rRNA (guanosine2251-2'-O)-methyltransferase